MYYWIAAYLAGMVIVASFYVWAVNDEESKDYENRFSIGQCFALVIAVLFWPASVLLALPVVLFEFFYTGLERKSHEDPIS